MGKGGIFPLGGELWGKKGGTISKCVVRRTHACLTFLIKAGEFGKLAESDTKRSWSLDKNLPSSMSRLLYWRNLLTANCRYSKRVYWKFQRISRRVHWLFSTFPLSGSVECVIPSLPPLDTDTGLDWLTAMHTWKERESSTLSFCAVVGGKGFQTERIATECERERDEELCVSSVTTRKFVYPWKKLGWEGDEGKEKRNRRKVHGKGQLQTGSISLESHTFNFTYANE